MSDRIELKPIHPEHAGAKRPVAMDIVFIHGLGGDWDATWRFDPGSFWPGWLATDHPDVQVWCLGYPAKVGHLATLNPSAQADSSQLAIAALTHLRDHRIGQRPCIFVCHSLGGLVAKRMLLKANQSDEIDRFKHENVAGIVFFGTPHRGSAIADLLRRLESVKDHLPAVLGQVFGAAAHFPAGHVLATSSLIEELKQGSVGLQQLNESFVLYYSERQRNEPLRVRVFAEKLPLKIKGVPTVVVVDEDSANPNLKALAAAAEVEPVFVLDADHSTLVKLQSKDGQVWKSLTYLISQILDDKGRFSFEDPRRNEAARAIYAVAKGRPALLNLTSLQVVAPGTNDAERAHALAARLVDAGNTKKASELVSELRAAMDELADSATALSADVHALEKITAWMLTLALEEAERFFSAARGQGVATEFGVPVVGDVGDTYEQAYLSLMIEVCHAHLRQWPTRWKLSEDRTTPLSGAWVMQSEAVTHPSSWHNSDHLQHLQERIVASRAEGRAPKGLVLRNGPLVEVPVGAATDAAAGVSARPSRANLALELTAKKLLNIRFKDKNSLVIAAAQTGSPYLSDALRSDLAACFGALVAVALPDHSQANSDDLLEWIVDMQLELQQFMLAAQEAHERVQSHA